MATNNAVIKGIMALSEGLRFVSSKYPLVVLIGPEVSWVEAEKLKLLGLLLIPFEPIPLPDTVRLLMPHWRQALNKLHIWSLIQFEKIVWMDSDQLILRNIDAIFNRLALFEIMNSFPVANIVKRR